jgi:hypothetical protein
MINAFVGFSFNLKNAQRELIRVFEIGVQERKLLTKYA